MASGTCSISGFEAFSFTVECMLTDWTIHTACMFQTAPTMSVTVFTESSLSLCLCLYLCVCSKAALWLGRLRLQCTEDQQRALVGLLSHSLAFGPVSSWGTDVFLEIGTLAGTPHTWYQSSLKIWILGLRAECTLLSRYTFIYLMLNLCLNLNLLYIFLGELMCTVFGLQHTDIHIQHFIFHILTAHILAACSHFTFRYIW